MTIPRRGRTAYRVPLDDNPPIERADAAERIVRAFDAGQDTAAIAVFLRTDEAAVSEILQSELDSRRRARLERANRYFALARAWRVRDGYVNRAEIARRFGYKTAAIAGTCLSRWLRRHGGNFLTERGWRR